MRRRLLLTAPLLIALGACAEMDTVLGTAPARTFPLFFAADSAALGENAQSIVASAVEAAKANPQARVVVKGFASPDTGSVEFNRVLSEARARAVSDALVAGGIPATRIAIEPRGAVPSHMFPTESRRVEIHIGG